MTTITSEHNKDQNHQLCLDHVLSSQAELGPKIPDGGYGWIILVACSFFQILIPSLPVGYGTILLFSRLENGLSTDPSLWDMKVIYVPLFFIIIWTLTEPYCRKIVYDSTWPRFVSIAATCLTSAGLLIMWIAINNRKTTTLYIAAGSISGFGASLLLTQVDIIISQYFYLRLKFVRILLTTFSAFGFVITPIVLGYNIRRIGILQCISWYQAIILQGTVISIAFKKPAYLKLDRSRYNLLRGIADEEEDIFTKSTIELQNTRASFGNNSTAVSSTYGGVSKSVQPQSLQEELRQVGWESFSDDTNESVQNKHKKLNVAFAVEFSNNGNNKINRFEDNYVEIPQPLFSESYLNNNISYSYESSPVETDNPVVFMPIPDTSSSKWTPDFRCFKELTFYKTLFLVITLKYTVFLFWTLFPSYLYFKIEHLKVHHSAIVVGCVGIVGIIFSMIATGIKINTNIRITLVSFICWIGAAGCLILSDSRTETFIVFSAVLIILNLNSLQILGAPLMKFNLPGEQSSGHLFISTITAACLISILAIELSYQNCFQFLAVLQLIAGSLLFTNVIYKKIKTYMSYH